MLWLVLWLWLLGQVACCLFLCFGTCGWELRVNRGSEYFTTQHSLFQRVNYISPPQAPSSAPPLARYIHWEGVSQESGTVTKSGVLSYSVPFTNH